MSVMLTKESCCKVQTTYHIPIDGQGDNQGDWLIIDVNAQDSVNIKLCNEYTDKHDNYKEYYYMEIHIDSPFYDVVKNVLEKIGGGNEPE